MGNQVPSSTAQGNFENSIIRRACVSIDPSLFSSLPLLIYESHRSFGLCFLISEEDETEAQGGVGHLPKLTEL